MSDPAVDEGEDAKPAKKSGGGTSKVILLAVLGNMLLSGGAVAVVLLKPSGAAAHETGKKKGAEHAEGAEGAEAEGAAPAAEEHGEAKPAEGGEHGGGGEGKPAEGGGATSPGGGPLVRVENIVVHLRNPEIDRYVRIAVDVELARTSDLAAFQSALPKVRDAIIVALADRTFEQLSGADGIDTLKRDLLGRTNDIIGAGRVRAVYLSDFVVQ